jgi:hypothetical protein
MEMRPVVAAVAWFENMLFFELIFTAFLGKE